MKWTIHELMKHAKTDNQINTVVDLSQFIDGTDIISISDVKVQGEYEVFDQEEFVFYLEIECELILPCAITLKEVHYPMHIETEEVFTTFKDDDSHYIEGITIDLLPIIWSNILLEMPMRVISEGAYDEVTYENDEFEEEVTNVFADLKNYDK
ncbi:YceD family protein [Candidatus Xianfuyuplasma coldseepsis]|uniref:DUF177 domain-containing protein n=1 Tax=Candidatus Xianfuyuplasma coldseepsis TaxID=2782163 RepID=A0A7L7KUB8_9MOLU|nr:YceD family protein [Xianfuyuplasma coldseepsis]QMS85594.1 DUF177 domain-containing protein [Xianfuyuplasma coldseepsis]